MIDEENNVNTLDNNMDIEDKPFLNDKDENNENNDSNENNERDKLLRQTINVNNANNINENKNEDDIEINELGANDVEVNELQDNNIKEKTEKTGNTNNNRYSNINPNDISDPNTIINSKQRHISYRKVECWYCHYIVISRPEWEQVKCTHCGHINSLPPILPEEFEDDLPTEQDKVEIVEEPEETKYNEFVDIICPFCKYFMRTKNDSRFLICTKCHNTIIIAKHPHAIPQYLPNICNPYKDKDGILSDAKVVLNKNVVNPLNRTTGLLESIFNPLVDPYAIEKEFERFLKKVAQKEFSNWNEKVNLREKQLSNNYFEGLKKEKVFRPLLDLNVEQISSLYRGNNYSGNYLNDNNKSKTTYEDSLYKQNNDVPQSSVFKKAGYSSLFQSNDRTKNNSLHNYSKQTEHNLINSMPEYFFNDNEYKNPYKNNDKETLYKSIFNRHKYNHSNISNGLNFNIGGGSDYTSKFKSESKMNEYKKYIEERSNFDYDKASRFVYNPVLLPNITKRNQFLYGKK